ncbi:hypothetical protein HU200_049706 [Digitaria exilis]|uniref:Uncharacterized protein n=1 Tax=Digitaria exilis TaxID=1010633 RepID=A0A835AZ04_9POAL|nr:hypothetical protein HU200_049706 [Digitaria exilis]
MAWQNHNCGCHCRSLIVDQNFPKHPTPSLPLCLYFSLPAGPPSLTNQSVGTLSHPLASNRVPPFHSRPPHTPSQLISFVAASNPSSGAKLGTGRSRLFLGACSAVACTTHARTYLKKSGERATDLGRCSGCLSSAGMSSSSSSSSAASASAVFPPSSPPPPLLVENLPPLHQLTPVAAAPPSSEQLCYVHCHFCDTVLVVSVPTSSLFKTVTVRCGHCSSLLTVNMRGLLFPGTPTSTAAAPTDVTSTTTTTITTAPATSVNNTGQFNNFPSSLNLAPNPPHHQSLLDEISSTNQSLHLLEQHGLGGLISAGGRNPAAPTPPQPPSVGKGAKDPSPRSNPVVNRLAHTALALPHCQELESAAQLLFQPDEQCGCRHGVCYLAACGMRRELQRTCALCEHWPYPPEKRQRVPSAYNRFINHDRPVVLSATAMPPRWQQPAWAGAEAGPARLALLLIICIDLTSAFSFLALPRGRGKCDCRDEIQRIKAGNPDISHREAFSAAAKNVSGFLPPLSPRLKKTNLLPQVINRPITLSM